MTSVPKFIQTVEVIFAAHLFFNRKYKKYSAKYSQIWSYWENWWRLVPPEPFSHHLTIITDYYPFFAQDKSKLDWDKYKKESGLQEELANHNKSKNRYTFILSSQRCHAWYIEDLVFYCSTRACGRPIYWTF